MPTLSPLAALQVVIMTTCSADSEDKVGIMITLCFRWNEWKWLLNFWLSDVPMLTSAPLSVVTRKSCQKSAPVLWPTHFSGIFLVWKQSPVVKYAWQPFCLLDCLEVLVAYELGNVWNLNSLGTGRVKWNFTCTKNKGSSIWQLCHHWWHRKLSLRQLTVPPVMTKLSNWRPYVFCVSIR